MLYQTEGGVFLVSDTANIRCIQNADELVQCSYDAPEDGLDLQSLFMEKPINLAYNPETEIDVYVRSLTVSEFKVNI